MIKICRAEDGQVFQVNASIRDIEVTGSLELFLYQEIGVEQDAVVAYLSDGKRLTTGNIRDLGSAQDQFIFVFNKHYLDYELEDVLRQLHVDPPFQPTIEDVTASTPPIRHTQLAASYARTSHMHHEHIQQLFRSLHFQHQAIQIASTTLDFNVLTISETFEGIASNARRELEKQNSLLAGLDADLELISRVGVHVEFCSTAVRMAIEAGDPHRVLGDYVSKHKMKQVADACVRTHEDLQSRFIQVEQGVNRLKDGADAVRATLIDTNLFLEAEACCQRSQDILDRITDAAATLESPASDLDSLLQELKHLDNSHRHELEQVTNRKNIYTRRCLTVLHHISSLNNEIVHLPPALSALQSSFRGKTSFSHIQRLHTMLYAYGATIIEIVRRKEFSRFFFQRAQSILEVMAKASANEKKRRQVYRGEVHGLLPFETRGMDDSVPTIDFSPTGSSDSVYSFERADVDGLLHVLDDLENYMRSSNDSIGLRAVQECRIAMEKLIVKMDSLESGFDKIAERSLLSASRTLHSRRRSTEAEAKEIQDLANELNAVHEAKVAQEHAFLEKRSAFEAEIRQLKTSFLEADSSLSVERERSFRLERELQQVRSQMESEGVARRILEERNIELSADISKQRDEIANALSDATDQTKETERLRQELAQVRADFEEVKALERRNADKVVHLLQEQGNSLRHLEEARARGEDLEIQIQAARAESNEVHQALQEASSEKDRLLKAQASEHDRIIRDHIAEADGDRAVLDRQFSELQAVLEHKERELKNLRGDLEVSKADAVGLREEYLRINCELRDARDAERVLRNDLKAGRASQSDFEQRTENSNRLIAQILDVAINFRDSHIKALHAAQAMATHPNSRQATSNLAESTFSASGFRHNVIGHPDEPSPIDPSDPGAALELLREFDHDHFIEAVMKTGSTIRKWQKQCKEYRERAKGKISFRKFAKGDLALFLPTRNSISKPWAAFNVSFPHYFLQATGHLAEQLKTREWIVARITSIAERVVDQKDPTSNPYGLGDGVKYYMLEVEDWTQPSHSKRRLSSRKTITGDNESSDGFQTGYSKLSPSALPPPGPPETEVEDTFLITHPQNSHPFLARARASSSPSARPSSLSRLLAQASACPDGVSENLPPSNTIPEVTSPTPPLTPPPPSPTYNTGSAPHGHNNAPSVPSPLRPGSRASRLSATSRFSVGRIPVLATVTASLSKASATTALSEQAVASSPSSNDGSPFESPLVPSPEESVSEGTSHRRRTTSYHTSRPSPLASSSSQSTVVPSRPALTASDTLATLANSWGMPFGRKKKSELGNLALAVESPVDDARGNAEHHTTDNTSVHDLLKRL